MNTRYMLELNSFPKELILLCSLIALHNDSELPDVILNKHNDLDWDYFLELTRHHRVYPIVYSNLEKWNGNIPAAVMRALKADYRNNILQMLQLRRELELLCKSFQENQICSLVLKGPELAEELYGDISLRTSKDIDFLVPRKDIEKVDDILLTLGFVAEPFPFAAHNGRRHHNIYYHPIKRFQIEIHWRLNPDTGGEPSFIELWKRRRPGLSGNGYVNVLGQEDLFFFLITHGARHSWFRLRWLADIDRIIRKRFEWECLSRQLIKNCCLPMAGQAFILSAHLLHTPISSEMGSYMSGRLPNQLALSAIQYIKDNQIPITTTHFIRYQFLLKTPKQRWSYIFSQLFPTSKDTEVFPLPKILHFVYFPLRPFLLVWRRMKRLGPRHVKLKRTERTESER